MGWVSREKTKVKNDGKAPKAFFAGCIRDLGKLALLFGLLVAGFADALYYQNIYSTIEGEWQTIQHLKQYQVPVIAQVIAKISYSDPFCYLGDCERYAITYRYNRINPADGKQQITLNVDATLYDSIEYGRLMPVLVSPIEYGLSRPKIMVDSAQPPAGYVPIFMVAYGVVVGLLWLIFRVGRNAWRRFQNPSPFGEGQG